MVEEGRGGECIRLKSSGERRGWASRLIGVAVAGPVRPVYSFISPNTLNNHHRSHPSLPFPSRLCLPASVDINSIPRDKAQSALTPGQAARQPISLSRESMQSYFPPVRKRPSAVSSSLYELNGPASPEITDHAMPDPWRKPTLSHRVSIHLPLSLLPLLTACAGNNTGCGGGPSPPTA